MMIYSIFTFGTFLGHILQSCFVFHFQAGLFHGEARFQFWRVRLSLKPSLFSVALLLQCRKIKPEISWGIIENRWFMKRFSCFSQINIFSISHLLPSPTFMSLAWLFQEATPIVSSTDFLMFSITYFFVLWW